MKIKQILMLSALVMVLGASCKKTKVTPPVVTPPPVTPPPTTATRAESTKDSIFYYAKEIYLWNDKLPTYEVFDPRKYTRFSTQSDNYDEVLFEISKYSNPFEYKPGYTEAKYSYIFDKANQNPTASINKKASVDLEGNGNDVGINVGFYGTEANYTVYMKGIYQNSPAEKAGFIRGDKITKINGVSYGTDYTITKALTILNALGNDVTLEGIKNNGTSFSITLNKAVYKSSPIYKSSVITVGAKKVGYLAYARFSNADNSITELNNAFKEFADQGVTDLVIDFRYNGGGYVSTAEHLINLIAPSTATGVMFTEHYNATMQNGRATILANQPLLDANDKVQFRDGKMITYADINYSVAGNTANFAKKGALTNVSNAVFIVSSNTASASELVINSLKPKMNVKLVGQKTYGKPVGFFPITIENKYDVYYSMFESKNSLGQGGYYDGFTPDVIAFEVPATTMMYDFGNVNDNYLKLALNILAPGIVVSGQAKTMTVRQKALEVSSSQALSEDLTQREFVGMIENRFKRK